MKGGIEFRMKNVLPKQYVLVDTLEKFQMSSSVDKIMVVASLKWHVSIRRRAQLMEFSSIHKLQRYNTFEGNTMYQHVLDTYL